MSFKKLTLFCVALLFVASLSIAQVRDLGTFVGTVSDLEHTVLPGVTITAKNIDTGLTQSTISNDQGRYRLDRIPVGNYNLSASLAGFKTMVKEGLVVQAGSELKVNFGLEIGKIEESVTVVSVSPMVETTRSQVSTVITEREILGYPQGNRNYLSLMAYAPGTLPGAGRSGYALNGMRGASNNFMIDGIDNNDNGTASAAVTSLPPEAIQEFRVVANNFSAEYGRNSGGVINTVMKSGTNEFHGSAWAFHRGGSSVFQTADWLTHDYPPLKRWQYGGTVGGPIIRDRLFFFLSYEGVYEDSGARTPYLFFTPEAIANAQGSAAQYFSQYGGSYPVPTYDFEDLDGDGTYDAGKYVWNGVSHTRGSVFGAKFDWIASEKDRVAVRWLYNNYRDYWDFANVPGFEKETPYSYHTGGITWLHLFSPTMYNELRVGYHRDYADWPRVAPEVPALGGYTYHNDGVHVVGDWPNMPQEFANNTYQLVDVLNFQKGNHSIKVGGEIRFWNSASTFDANVAGAYYFYSSLDWIYNYGAYYLIFGGDPPDPPADNPYLKGASSGTWAKGDSSRKWASFEGGIFVQDDWRATDRLTVSLGLRWEFFGVPQEKSGIGINMPAFGTLAGYNNTVNGNYDITEGTYSVEGIKYAIWDGRQLLGESLWNNYYKAFAPKISFAYDLTGDGKTSVRGGFGISYDRTFNNTYENDRFNYPMFTFVSIYRPDLAINPTIPFEVSGIQQFITNYRIACRWMMPDLIPQSAYNWLFGIQRELGANTSIEVNYTGSHGKNLGSIQRPNRFTGDRLDGVANGINAYAAITDLNLRIQNLRSNYNALQVVVNKRFAQGWSTYVAYTYGNAYDQNSDYFGDNASMEAVSNERIDMEYGFAQFDRRSRLVGGFVYDIPWGKKSGNWVIKNILAGWQVSGNFHYTGGAPFNIRAASGSYDWNKDYDSNDRPLWLGGDYQDIITWTNGKPGWDKSHFGIPIPPAYAEDLSYYNQNFAERNAFRWFPTYNLNLAFQKYFAVPMGGGRDLNIQLIAEIFNVFKWLTWDLPATSWTSSQFGISQRMSGNRTAQFSLRFMF